MRSNNHDLKRRISLNLCNPFEPVEEVHVSQWADSKQVSLSQTPGNSSGL
jgi:hypothetical protein